MNYRLVSNIYTYVEVKNQNNVTTIAKSHGYGINIGNNENCVNLVIPSRVPEEQAKEQAKQFGFEITGIVEYH